MGIKVGGLPVKYLGFPLNSTRLKDNDCNVLVDKLMYKINNWTNIWLSYAGMIQLASLVLRSIQICWISIFLLLKSVIKDIDQILGDSFGFELSLRNMVPRFLGKIFVTL